ncbi:spore-associated protein [Streptomyces virginiae]|uniref:spore-associated protein n=1 Tax=Streptomyces virginiae TaxID=1961 RepID=UPI003631DB2F
MRKTIISLAALTTAVAGANLALAPTASAAGYGCAGNLKGSYNILAGGEVWSTVQVYYSAGNGGTNCAVNIAKKYAGQRTYMQIHIRKSGTDKGVSDSGHYTSYAGPVNVTGTNGRCITVSGEAGAPNGNSAGWMWSDILCG